jgi:hypothetical protein
MATKGKTAALPPGERERQELHTLIREAHEAAQDLKRQTAESVELWRSMSQETVDMIDEIMAKNCEAAIDEFNRLLAKYVTSSGESMENFHRKVFGAEELPPHIYTAMMMTCVTALADLLKRQANHFAENLKQTAVDAMLSGETITGERAIMASQIAAIVQGRAVFDAPLLNEAITQQLFGSTPDYSEVENMRKRLLETLTEQGAAIRKHPGEFNPMTMLVPYFQPGCSE